MDQQSKFGEKKWLGLGTDVVSGSNSSKFKRQHTSGSLKVKQVIFKVPSHIGAEGLTYLNCQEKGHKANQCTSSPKPNNKTDGSKTSNDSS